MKRIQTFDEMSDWEVARKLVVRFVSKHAVFLLFSAFIIQNTYIFVTS